MIRNLICVVVVIAAVTPLAASAEATVYGRVRNALVSTDYDNPEPGSEEAGVDEQWDVEDNSSRLGVKGSEDLGNGVRAILRIELQMETTDGGSTSRPTDGFGTRLGYVGLDGDFGTLIIGRQWTPYHSTVHKTDVWQLAGMDDWYLGEYRQGNMITYASPDFRGFGGKLAAITDGQRNESDGGKTGADWYNASLDYQNGPLSVGLSYMKYLGGDDYYQAGIAARYVYKGIFGLTAQYEKLDDTIIDGVDLDLRSYAIQGEYYFGNNTLRVGYGNVDENDDIHDNFDTWSLGLEHGFSRRTRIYAEYQETDHNQNSPSDWAEWYNSGRPDHGNKKFGLGLRHDF